MWRSSTFRPHPEERPKAASRRTAAGLALYLFLAAPASSPPTPKPPTPSSSTARSSSTTRAPAQALAVRDGKIAGDRKLRRHPRAGRSRHPRHRSRRPHRHPRPDRFPHPRHPRRALLHHRGALDRRPHAGRSARPHPRRGASARRRAPGSSSPAAGPSGSSRRTAGRRRAEIAAAAPDHHVYIQQLYSRVLLDPGGYEALGIARNPDLAARAHRRARRRRPADRLAHRRQPRHQRSVRSAAAPDLRAEGRGHPRVLPRAQRGRHHRRDRSRRLQSRRSPTTSRCSRSGASAG